MLNQITIMGRLTRDPELKRTNSGKSVCNFTLAVEDDFKPENGERDVDYIDCSAWQGTAEFVGKYFTKGRMAVVTGKVKTGSYEKDGQKHKTFEVRADNVYFADSKKPDSNGQQNDAQQGGYSAPQGGQQYGAPQQGGYAPQNGQQYGGPQQGGYVPQGGQQYGAPQQGGYAPQNGQQYGAPQQGGYAPQNGQQYGVPQQGGYPSQGGGNRPF